MPAIVIPNLTPLGREEITVSSVPVGFSAVPPELIMAIVQKTDFAGANVRALIGANPDPQGGNGEFLLTNDDRSGWEIWGHDNLKGWRMVKAVGADATIAVHYFGI